MKSAEQQARDMLERIGVPDAQSYSAGDLVELANLLNEHPPDKAEAWNGFADKGNATFVKLPVLDGFDSTKPIGWLSVMRSALPPLPNYHFALAFRVEGSSHEVLSVSLVLDGQFLAYEDWLKR